MISLSTQIPQLLFSSAILDLAINTDGDGEVEIALTSNGNTVFTASHGRSRSMTCAWWWNTICARKA